MTENSHPDGTAGSEPVDVGAIGEPTSDHPNEPQTSHYEPVQQHTNVYEPAQPTPAYPTTPDYDPYTPSFFGPEPPIEQPQYGGGYAYPVPEASGPSAFVPGAPAFGAPLASSPAHKPGRTRPMLAVAVVAAVVGGGVGAGTVALVDHNGKTVNTGLKITNTTAAPAAQLDGSIGAAAAKIRPSVVTIEVSGAQASGTGSGVIIRDDGYILTNAHVVSIGGSSGGTIDVTLTDGRTTPGKIVGRDAPDDLAVIKVDGLSGLTAAIFAKSTSLSVGQAVVAVGAPLGLSDTVTSGIISNLARPVRAGDNNEAVFEAVQTDAAINPGNSGGPLVDLNGSVVGINAAIATDNSSGGLQIPGQTQQSGNIGIGFAIPADEASRIASELIATGKATHAVLGVTVGGKQPANSAVGVPLRTVSADGAAAKAGLKVDDLVTAVNDQPVATSDALIAAVRSHAPGEDVKISYTRGGAKATVTVTLGKSDS